MPAPRRFAVLLAALLASGGVAAHPTGEAGDANGGPPKPLLWKVTDGDNSVYLLGTFHMLEPRDYPLDAKVYAALEDAEVVYFELAPEDLVDPTLGPRLAQAGIRTDGRKLQQDLDPATWSSLVESATAVGLDVQALQQMEPWFAALSISTAEMTAAGLDPTLGLDKHLAQRAVRLGKRTTGLEQPEEQIALFDGMKRPVQLAQLRDVVERAHEIRAEVEWLHDQWRQGDVDALYWGMAAAMKARDPDLFDRLNTRRNLVWLGRIKARLDAPGSDDALVAVGSLHLLGAEGLVQLMATSGYSVERL